MIKLIKSDIAVVPIFDPDELVKRAYREKVKLRSFDGGFEDVEVTGTSRIIVPEQAKERCDQGIVKYVGPEVKDIKIGDYVIYSGYTGTLIQLENEGKLIVFPERFAIAILPDPPVTSVTGLYFRDSTNGEYFEATYEIMMELLAQAFKNADWHHGFHVRSEKPKVEDFDIKDR